MQHLDLKFPYYVEFQTITSCNAHCVVCPYDEVHVGSVASRMSDFLIKKIVGECAVHRQNIKAIIPYLNNEPSLDSRILDILRFIRNSDLPVELSTNLSGFSKKKIQAIFSEGLIQDFRISCFGADKQTYTKMMPGLDFESTLEKLKYIEELLNLYDSDVNVTIVMILFPELDMQRQVQLMRRIVKDIPVRLFGYLDRAGNNSRVKNALHIRHDEEHRIIGCSLKRPMERICINYDGNVVLCSQDWRAQHILGNVSSNLIEGIWSEMPFNELRRRILCGTAIDQQNLLCRNCKLAVLESNSGETRLNFNGDIYVNPSDVKKLT